MKYILTVALGVVLLAGGCGSSQRVPGNDEIPSSNTISQSFQAMLGVEIDGVDFYQQNASPGSSISTPGNFRVSVTRPKITLRRIDPGIIPDNSDIWQINPAGDSNWQISGLPTGETLLLKISFTPKVDLVTGTAFPKQTEAREYAVHIPIRCETGTELNISAVIQIIEHPSGDFTSDTKAIITCGAVEDAVSTRMDYSAGLVSNDSDHDGHFYDEAWLADEDRIGISKMLAVKLASENAIDADQVIHLGIQGRLDSVDEINGKLLLEDAVEFTDDSQTKIGRVELNFAEGTRFDELLIDEYGEVKHNKAPRSIGQSKRISVDVSKLPDYGSTTPAYWINSLEELTLDFPDDTIVAVPSKQTAVTGEAVSITVYANQTAQPFFALENVRVVFEDSNEILHGSLNAGSRGGASVRADGIWADMNAEHVISSSKMTLSVVSTGDGQSYADFSLQPTGGNELLNATGALFNFQLICYGDATPGVQSNTGLDWITSFTDVNQQSHAWLNADDIQAIQIAVEGRPLRLSLVNPPAQGIGQEDTPYITGAGVSYQLRLIDPVFGEVAQHPDANYLYSTNGDIRQLSITDGVLSIAAGFAGDVWISGMFRNVYTREADQLHLLVDSAD